jgi:hypothetical protein
MIQALTNFFNALTSRPCTKNQPAGHNRSETDRSKVLQNQKHSSVSRMTTFFLQVN